MNELIDDIVYALYLINFEMVDNDHGKKSWKEFREMVISMEHCGDCTWDPVSCSR